MEEIIKRLIENRNNKNSQLDEMARVGFLDKKEIYIRTNDPGNIPHFHIWDISTMGDEFHTCIKIESPEYFHHEGKEDVLSSKEKKELIRFLSSERKNSRFKMTNWQYLVDLWNDNNPTHIVDP